MLQGNIFKGLHFDPDKEQTLTLVESGSVKIEKIVTSGQKSEKEFWYDQESDEFVIVLQGCADITFLSRTVRLGAGDYLFIKAHEKHQISWSDPNEITLWLAVFVKSLEQHT